MLQAEVQGCCSQGRRMSAAGGDAGCCRWGCGILQAAVQVRMWAAAGSGAGCLPASQAPQDTRCRCLAAAAIPAQARLKHLPV